MVKEDCAIKIKGGRTHYGQAIGIATLDTMFPRIPGDVANASTYNFPVRFIKVKGATVERVVKQRDPKLLGPFIKTTQKLERAGVRAITTSCGFLILFQDEIANKIKVPVFTSSLLQVPLVHRMLGKKQEVGIITHDSVALTKNHLKSAGIDLIPVAIIGMENKKEWAKIFTENTLDPNKVKDEIIMVSKELVSKNPDVGAIVLECTNMPPYAKAIQIATDLPVFDIVTLTNFVYYAVVRRGFEDGFM